MRINFLIDKTNIKNIKTDYFLINCKKEDLKVGDLCLTNCKYIGIVINNDINKNLKFFDYLDYEVENIIIFPVSENEFAYMPMNQLTEDLKDKDDGYCDIIKVLRSKLGKYVFDTKDNLRKFIKEKQKVFKNFIQE